ncbi:MAG TPA: zinc ribbon domain-containing protein [Candidatus Saccharimonadales bacterium]|nr:zinc ribbon domain-containing protein [Candidatus Saccharimonadales bacterium]
MKCSACSRDIPDGFADCPWCGANYGTLPQPAASAARPVEPGRNLVFAWLASAVSLPFCLFAAYATTHQKYGFLEMADSGYFIGAVLGPYLASTIIVFLYYWIRRRNPQYSTKLLAIACGASFFALLSLSQHLGRPGMSPEPVEKRHIAGLTGNSTPQANRPASVWDAPMLSLIADLRSFNDAYVSEVSKLDSAALPLYTPDSFRDAATIQQMLAQLRSRLAVAEKYSSVQPILDKMKNYLAAVNASEKEKREFLEGFASTAPAGLGTRDLASAREREWLRTSIDLYALMLAKQSAYAIAGRKVEFRQRGLAEQFNQGMVKAQVARQQFLQAQGAFTAAQQAARTQLGLHP